MPNFERQAHTPAGSRQDQGRRAPRRLPRNTRVLGRTAWLRSGLLLAMLAVTAPVAAQAVTDAANAFSQAQLAELAGDHARAASLYEMADRISPAAAALRSATRSRVAAEHWALAARNAERLLTRHPKDTQSRALAEHVLAEAKPKVMRLEATCSEPCSLQLDNLAVDVDSREVHVVYSRPGAHRLVASFKNGTQASNAFTSVAGTEGKVSLKPGSPRPSRTDRPKQQSPKAQTSTYERPRRDRTLEPPLKTPRQRLDAPEENKDGLHRKWFYTTFVTAVALGGAAAGTLITTEKRADEFDKNPTKARFDSGLRLQRTGNSLLFGAAASGLTAAVMAFWTDFGPAKDQKRGRVTLQPMLGHTGVGLHLGGAL